MRLPAYMVGLASGVTAGAGVLVLRLLEPAELDWAPFVYVAAVSLVLAAAAGAWHFLSAALRARKARRRAAAADAARLRELHSQAWLTALARRPDRVNQLIRDALAEVPDHEWLRRGEGEQ